MPYHIKNETPDITAKMERCVSDIMAKGVKKFKGRDPKSSAIAICKSSMMKGAALSKKLNK